MTTKDIEELATNAVRKSILTSGSLSPYITDNDKGPSWDGFVYVYSSAEKTKKDFLGRIPVQVKGTESEDLSRDKITFSVETDDLHSYIRDGGVIFFVTCIAQGGLADRIYFAELTVDRLRALLDACPAGQQTKRIALTPFPIDAAEKVRVFRDFCQHYRKPASALLFPGTPTLPSYWQGPGGILSEDRLLDALAEPGVHILDLHYGNQVPQLVRKLHEERCCDAAAVPFDELTDQLVGSIRVHGDTEAMLLRHFSGLAPILFFRDLDLLAGRPATEKMIVLLAEQLAEAHSVILSGSYLQKNLPSLRKAFPDADYYEICQ